MLSTIHYITLILKTVLTKSTYYIKELIIFKGNSHHSQNGGALKAMWLTEIFLFEKLETTKLQLNQCQNNYILLNASCRQFSKSIRGDLFILSKFCVSKIQTISEIGLRAFD